MTQSKTVQSERLLEEQFFAKQNKELTDRLKKELEKKERALAIAHATGLNDHGVIDEIARLEISVQHLAAFRLIPLLIVAWADDRIDSKERAAILAAANETGLKEGEASYAMLTFWLDNRPPAEFFEIWKKYALSLKDSLGEASWRELASQLLSLTTRVAQAAGGFLGIGAVSTGERNVLKHVEEVLQ